MKNFLKYHWLLIVALIGLIISLIRFDVGGEILCWIMILYEKICAVERIVEDKLK